MRNNRRIALAGFSATRWERMASRSNCRDVVPGQRVTRSRLEDRELIRSPKDSVKFVAFFRRPGLPGKKFVHAGLSGRGQLHVGQCFQFFDAQTGQHFRLVVHRKILNEWSTFSATRFIVPDRRDEVRSVRRTIYFARSVTAALRMTTLSTGRSLAPVLTLPIALTIRSDSSSATLPKAV